MQIVAPAGSFDGLVACIKGGADAVYMGLPQFGARAKAENFDRDNFVSAVELAHLFGVKVFVTLNTLIKDSEMPQAIELADFACSVGADAAIVQDIRLIKQLKHKLPYFTLHASTQMGVHNVQGAEALKSLGITRAVLARETLPDDIAAIKKTGIEIEYFVQGALCVCFSGNCYFSSLASSYSGNRGKCMQLCRKPYVFNGKRGYFLSAKDLCLYDKLDYLKELGVDAIKIEGRMRSPEYAYTAVKVYKSRDSAKPVEELKTVFNRGDFFDGYLSADAPFKAIYSKSQANIGVPIGKISKLKGKSIVVNGFTPHNNDGFKVMRSSMEVCGASVHGGNLTVDGACKVGDELRRTYDGALAERIKSIDRKIQIAVNVIIKAGSAPSVDVKLCNGNTITVIGENPAQSAISCGLRKEDIIKVFGKVGEYPFAPTISVDISDNVFMPISELNELRRKTYAAVKAAILADYHIKRSAMPYSGFEYNRFEGKGIMLMVENGDQLNSKILSAVDYVVLNPRDYNKIVVPSINKPILLNLPITMRGKDQAIISAAIDQPEIYGVVSNNIYGVNITNKPVLLGTGHNIVGECEYPHITSYEADSIGNGFVYTFGYAPLMTLCHCPYGKCIHCPGDDCIKDDSGRLFKLRKYTTAHCYWQLLNCVPHWQSDSSAKNRFYDCTVSSPEQIVTVLRGEYRGAFTRGNTNKGLK